MDTVKSFTITDTKAVQHKLIYERYFSDNKIKKTILSLTIRLKYCRYNESRI